MDFWVTAKECVGICSFPNAEKNVRKHLESFVSGRSELRRKRACTSDLGVPSDTPVPETDTGKLIIVSENRRLFTRNNLKGVL